MPGPASDVSVFAEPTSQNQSRFFADMGLRTDPERMANARELVKRWNAFPELLDACNVALITLKDVHSRHARHKSFHSNRVESDSNDAIEILTAAIKAAESEV